MLQNVSERFQRSKEVFANMPPLRRYLILGGIAALTTIFVVFMIWTNRTEYSVLYSGLSQQDAGAIVDQLEKANVPYRLEADGTIIKVPRESVQQSRLMLAQEGLPTGGSIGMEVFDESHLGETEFLQQLNFQRALQGELERTIKEFDSIEQVRVHLNVPKQSLFIEEERPPSASVVLSLNRGQTLSRNELQGIVHLVASSVEGLTAENVTVVDTDGGLLYSDQAQQEGVLTERQIEYRQELETSLAQRVTGMLERIVGPDKAMSRVNAELDLKHVSTNEEVFDPDRAAIRSEQRLSESSQGPSDRASGIPQTSFELGTGNQDQGQGQQGEVYERSEETTNYEITRINRQTQSSAGDVRRLSVAVLVDGIYEETVQDGQTIREYVPRPQRELDQLTQLVKNAVGFDESRGDSVVVESVQFWLPEKEALSWWERLSELLSQYGRSIFNILLIVLFFLFVVRPFASWLKRETEPEAPEEGLEALPEGETGVPEIKHEPGVLTREQVLALAQQEPERTLNVLKSWIGEESAEYAR